MVKLTLPTNSEERKDVPVLSGCLNYFPAAMAWIARISLKGDRKHNPENKGNPPFHARGKSMDHGDCIIRHTMDIEDLKAYVRRTDLVQNNSPAVAQLLEEAAYRAWRACADLQELCEKYDGAPLAPAARLPDGPQQVMAEIRPVLDPFATDPHETLTFGPIDHAVSQPIGHGNAGGTSFDGELSLVKACGKQYYSLMAGEDRNCKQPYGHKGACGDR